MSQHRKPPHEHINITLKCNHKWQKREMSIIRSTTLACVDLSFAVPSSFLVRLVLLLLHFAVYLVFFFTCTFWIGLG